MGNTQEIWKDIAGFEGLYLVSNMGNIKSCERLLNRRNNTTITINEKVKSPFIGKPGYKVVALWRENKHKLLLVHRLIAQAFIPNPQSKAEVNHKDGNKLNNSLDNLEWVTHQENGIHAYKNGLTPKAPGNNKRGEQITSAVLTSSDVIRIRNLFSKKEYTQKQLGAMFGVTRSAIQGVTTRKTWKHITAELL